MSAVQANKKLDLKKNNHTAYVHVGILGTWVNNQIRKWCLLLKREKICDNQHCKSVELPSNRPVCHQAPIVKKMSQQISNFFHTIKNCRSSERRLFADLNKLERGAKINA